MDSNLYGHKTAEFFWVAQCLLGTIRAIIVIRIASFLSHANVFCQTYSHSIHFGAETSHSLSTLQQYILVSL